MNIDSTDYHDFVIKDGKLIGEFEQMYSRSNEVPWHQDKQDGWLDVRLTVELLREYAPFDYICDFGCGLGYFLDILRMNFAAPQSRKVGLDVSATGCKMAHRLFPYMEFYVYDLMKRNNHYTGVTIGNRLFSLRGTLWYVFPKMDTVVKNIADSTVDGDYLLVSQNFPPLYSEFVGKDIISSPDELVDWFRSYFTPVKSIWLQDRLSSGNDNWFICLFRR